LDKEVSSRSPDGFVLEGKIQAFVFYDCWGLTSAYFTGNAPASGYEMFMSDPTTVYYLPGATGWSSTFGGAPVVMWNPAIQTDDGGFGAENNQFGFNINWISSP
jgi:hypothetical protein